MTLSQKKGEFSVVAEPQCAASLTLQRQTLGRIHRRS